MGMSDIIFDALVRMDERVAGDPNVSETDRRYQELYRLTTNAMRILQTFGDHWPRGNDDAYLDRGMELITSNDQRPWEEIFEDLMRASRSPVVLPPDPEGRQIVLAEPPIPAPPTPQQPPEQPPRIRSSKARSSSSAERPEFEEELRKIYVPLDVGSTPVTPAKKKTATAKPKVKTKAVIRSAKRSNR